MNLLHRLGNLGKTCSLCELSYWHYLNGESRLIFCRFLTFLKSRFECFFLNMNFNVLFLSNVLRLLHAFFCSQLYSTKKFNAKESLYNCFRFFSP